MTTEHPPHDSFTTAYTALVEHLASSLDLTAGADDATHPATYTALAADLSTALDLGAGLADIIGADDSTPSPHTTRADRADRTAGTSIVHRVIDRLGTLTDLERLDLRAHLSYRTLRLALDLDHALDHSRDRARELALNLAVPRALDDVVARHTDDLERLLDLALDLALDLNDALDLGPGHTTDRELTYALKRTRDAARNFALDLARDRLPGHAAHKNLDPSAARARELIRRARARDSAQARNRDRAIALDHALTHHRALVHELVLDLAAALASHLNLDVNKKPESSALSDLLAVLTQVGDDFAGADLRATGHRNIDDLAGIRWSTTTSWPSGWEGDIRAASTEIEPGIFQIVGEQGERHAPTRAGT